MKKLIIILSLFFVSKNIFSQANKLNYYSISYTFQNSGSTKKDISNDPLFSINISIAKTFKQKILTLSYNKEFNYNVASNYLSSSFSRRNFEFSLLYGKKFKYKNFIFQPNIGIGYFTEVYEKSSYREWNEEPFWDIKAYDDINLIKLKSISFASIIRILYEYSAKVTIGLSYNLSLNSVNNQNNFGVVFQHKF
jgi:hypothetical protein